MNDQDRQGGSVRRKAPVHLWIVGVVSLLWNFVGIFDYLATKLQADFYMSQFSEAQLEYFYGFPAWMTAAWAFGVWGAFAGSVGLLLRKKWAMWAFGASLAGLAVSSIYNFGFSNGLEIMGTGGAIFTLVIWAIAIFLFVYSKKQVDSGVLS